MTDTFAVSIFEVLRLLGYGALLWLVLRGLAAATELAPIARGHRELLRAVSPLFAVAITLVYLLYAVQQLFHGHASAAPIMVGAVLLGFAAALYGPLRDVLAGVVLRAGRVVKAGERIRVGELHGRVEELGLRRLTLRTADGEAIVPYGLVSRAALVRDVSATRSAVHTFRVRPIPGVSAVELGRHVREGALLCHFTALGRAPTLQNAERGAIDVSVCAVSEEYVAEVEAAVRRRLSALEQARAAEALPRLATMPGVASTDELDSGRKDAGSE